MRDLVGAEVRHAKMNAHHILPLRTTGLRVVVVRVLAQNHYPHG